MQCRGSQSRTRLSDRTAASASTIASSGPPCSRCAQAALGAQCLLALTSPQRCPGLFVRNCAGHKENMLLPHGPPRARGTFKQALPGLGSHLGRSLPEPETRLGSPWSLSGLPLPGLHISPPLPHSWAPLLGRGLFFF